MIHPCDRLLLASLGVIASLGGGCADRLLLHPPKYAAAPAGAEQVMVRWTGGALQVWRRSLARGEPECFVLEFTGNASRGEYVVNDTAERWREAGAEVWAVNYPGYGESTGPAALGRLGPAALAAYDALAERAGGRPIYLVGRSLGTAVALHVAAERPAVAGILLHSPTPLRSVILGFGWWNLWLLSGPVAMQIPPELDALGNARRCRAPAVFLTTHRDTLVGPAHQQKVVAGYAGSKRVIDLRGADHNAGLTPGEEADVRAGIDWLRHRP